MEKIELSVLGLSSNSVTPNTSAMILKEIEGNRSLPIVIGGFEAQAIAIEMEKVDPPRPMTHDIIRDLIDATELVLTEVLIYDFKDGTFFSQLIFEEDDIEIDCRPSDAVAIALRCESPIYVYEHILDEVGMFANIQTITGNTADIVDIKKDKHSTIEQLKSQLERAIKNEDYELAAKLRDAIKLNTDINVDNKN